MEWGLGSITPATKFHEYCIPCVEDAARDMFGTSGNWNVHRMTSGAGHDR